MSEESKKCGIVVVVDGDGRFIKSGNESLQAIKDLMAMEGNSFTYQEHPGPEYIWNGSAWVPDTALVTAGRIRGIKKEANKRIVAQYPEWNQRNRIANTVESVVAVLKILVAKATLTVEEQATIDAALADIEKERATWEWVKTTRAKSDTLEGDPPENYQDDSHWPDPL